MSGTPSVTDVSFRLYTDEELIDICAVEIRDPLTFNDMNLPNRFGLYDPAMGPLDRFTPCKTCKQNEDRCPGHMGYISLPQPVIHPLLRQDLIKLLQITCVYCCRFRLSDSRFRLLDAGLVTQAIDLLSNVEKFVILSDDRLKSVIFNNSSKADVDYSANIVLDEEQKRVITKKVDELIKNNAPSEDVQSNATVFSERQKTIRDFFKERKAYCEHCGAKEHSFSNPVTEKTFVKYLPARELRDFVRSNPDKAIHSHFECLNAAITNMKNVMNNKPNHANDKDDAPNDKEGDDSSEQDEGQEKKKNKKKTKLTVREKNVKELEEIQLALGDQDNTAAARVSPLEMTNLVKDLWKNEPTIISHIYSKTLKGEQSSPGMFFLTCLPVMPSKFRPPAIRDRQMFENAQNGVLSKILTLCIYLRRTLDDQTLEKNKKQEDVDQSIDNLQAYVNELIDSSLVTKASRGLSKSIDLTNPGIRQTLEKKEGLFRKHIMGKRVNFAARSVILPDPSIATNEVSVPLVFAKVLSFPEPVQQHNLKKMRQLVVNGSDHYPGANYIEHFDGRITDLSHLSAAAREAASKRLRLDKPTKVYRHCVDGDMVLMNRQPTLHRPSIMAHRARIITNQRTIRIHYANCKSYNADFDGDEMNMHLPQNYIAQSEARELMQTSKQYSVPTSGEPIRGLIQDHIVSGVLLTCKDTFLDKQDYQHLVFVAIAHLSTTRKIELQPPAIMKPKPLWTGKQVISTIMKNIITHYHHVEFSTDDECLGFNLDCKTKIKANMWGSHHEEGVVVIRDSELLTGVLDKNQIGASKFGLVHMCDEIYGSQVSNELLTSLTRLFSVHLQLHGFTCGLDDCLMNARADSNRDEMLKQGDLDCTSSTITFATENNDTLQKLLKVDLNIRKLDAQVKSTLNKTTSSIIKDGIPNGQVKQFPKNFLTLMTESGAKGSLVNASQISCLLGQQEFEGRRVKHMISGKTLPCFLPYETNAQAGGYVASRFLTGIKPAEYFFHCMAGRDGLIDTAVKTARSGYLQRCLVKHLEPLTVAYDGSVRLNGSNVVQFKYGGDCIDPIKSGFLREFKFMVMNSKVLLRRYHDSQIPPSPALPTCDLEVSDPWNHPGQTSTIYHQLVDQYRRSNPDGLLHKRNEKSFARVAHLKYMQSMCEPGDPVGVLAAQGIGEPSTQMTLNTFHFAGLDVAHVTVGIPRLVELLHGGNVKQGLITIPCKSFKYGGSANHPLHKNVPIAQEELHKFATCQLSKIHFHDVLKCIQITESYSFHDDAHKSLKEQVLSVDLKFDLVDLEKYYEYPVDKFKSMLLIFKKALCHRLRALLKSKTTKASGNYSTKNRGEHLQLLKNEQQGLQERQQGGNHGDDDDDDDDENKSGELMNEREQGGFVDDQSDKKKERVSYDDDEEDQEDDDDDDEKKKKTRVPTDEFDDADVEMNNGQEQQSKASETTASDEQSIQQQLAEPESLGGASLEDFDFDKKTGALTFKILLSVRKRRLFLSEAIERTAKDLAIRYIVGVEKAYVLKNKANQLELTVEGSSVDNLLNLQRCHELLDLTQLRSNDPGEVARIFGIEAARQFVVNEIQQVFDSYGIPVDERHIGLIADYLTFQGYKTTCNRIGLQFLPGTLHKATFETATDFVKKATVYNEGDVVDDPSSQLLFGNLIKSGTGMFDVLQPVQE
ncbi:DNA-directed RNA polymerase I subunit RPA1 [Acrasis kona]|uniref:DNA-directed RNA polymerase subunit n=1 Tax=Acrasis kona TaxID=1008807 RepID=A0AAW2ZG59_9EUKA